MRTILGSLASEFAECADGAEAVAAFATLQPDWTIMDITMKGMDGLEATRRIKRHSPAALIMVLTQSDSAKVREAAFEAGASAFFSKDNLSQVAAYLSSPGSADP